MGRRSRASRRLPRAARLVSQASVPLSFDQVGVPVEQRRVSIDAYFHISALVCPKRREAPPARPSMRFSRPEAPGTQRSRDAPFLTSWRWISCHPQVPDLVWKVGEAGRGVGRQPNSRRTSPVFAALRVQRRKRSGHRTACFETSSTCALAGGGSPSRTWGGPAWRLVLPPSRASKGAAKARVGAEPGPGSIPPSSCGHCSRRRSLHPRCCR